MVSAINTMSGDGRLFTLYAICTPGADLVGQDHFTACLESGRYDSGLTGFWRPIAWEACPRHDLLGIL